MDAQQLEIERNRYRKLYVRALLRLKHAKDACAAKDKEIQELKEEILQQDSKLQEWKQKKGAEQAAVEDTDQVEDEEDEVQVIGTVDRDRPTSSNGQQQVDDMWICPPEEYYVIDGVRYARK